MSTQESWQRGAFEDLGGVLDGGAARDPGAETGTADPRATADLPGPTGEPVFRGAEPGQAPALPSAGGAAPGSVPVVAPELAGALGRVPHGDPFGRRVGAVFGRFFSSASGAAESVADTARRIQQPVTTGRQIAVSSIRGGAGKSTVAALMALTLAHYRTDPVLAVEADGVLGTLPGRLGAKEVRWTCSDIADVIDTSTPLVGVTGYLVPFTGGWLLPGSRGKVGRSRLDAKSFYMAMAALRRHFGATVVDCETLPAEVARLAIASTQARVLVAPATVEGVGATRLVLDWLDTLDPVMLPTTVVALAHTSPDMAVDLRRAAAHLEVRGVRMIPVPYDRSLAAGGAIRTDRLARATREAAARLAAAAMDRAVAHARGVRAEEDGKQL